MESISETCHKQRALIEFLDSEQETVVNIHNSLCEVYGRFAINRTQSAAVQEQ